MIILDSNVWIFAEIKDAPEYSAAARVVQELLPRGQVATSVVILSEVFHKIAGFFGRTQAWERLNRLFFHPSIHWLSFNQDTAGQAMKLAERAQLRINDALIAQQALELKAAVLTDDVRDFKKVAGLKVIPLR